MTEQVAIRTPEIGAGSQTIRVSSWLVDVGEMVNFGDRIVELLVKGMTFDVSSPETGLLMRIDRSLDAVVQPGDILGWLETADDITLSNEQGDSP
ncbi:MAG: hypothetical protein Tsb009_15340 [Planctomycetaceae bacterium]